VPQVQESAVLVFYNFFIRLYSALVAVASIWNEKAKEWKRGRRPLFTDLASSIRPTDRIIWVHCASAGELEQGKPVIETLKAQYPAHRILVSFFSPSGFVSGKKYKAADLVTYLPLDTASNARKFLHLTHPELVVFVKYEYWHHHLSEVSKRKIPLLLVSAIFREGAVFSKWYGGFFRRMLQFFTHIFVQDEASLQLLKSWGVHRASVSGDTRFDRVVTIASAAGELDIVDTFVNNEPTIVAGSTWPDDEVLLQQYCGERKCKLILAPHEMGAAHMVSISRLFPQAWRYSSVAPSWNKGAQEGGVWEQVNARQQDDLEKGLREARVLIIDNFGMLSRLYRYATISYIGGGFNKSGIHNTLEAAVWSKPVLFGPQYRKFREARELVERGAAYSFNNFEGLKQAADRLLDDAAVLQEASVKASQYVMENTGAVGKLLNYIQENRLLTR